ncbi:unnamed protein product, partial [Notodromas monacha]
MEVLPTSGAGQRANSSFVISSAVTVQHKYTLGSSSSSSSVVAGRLHASHVVGDVVVEALGGRVPHVVRPVGHLGNEAGRDDVQVRLVDAHAHVAVGDATSHLVHQLKVLHLYLGEQDDVNVQGLVSLQLVAGHILEPGEPRLVLWVLAQDFHKGGPAHDQGPGLDRRPGLFQCLLLHYPFCSFYWLCHGGLVPVVGLTVHKIFTRSKRASDKLTHILSVHPSHCDDGLASRNQKEMERVKSFQNVNLWLQTHPEMTEEPQHLLNTLPASLTT